MASCILPITSKINSLVDTINYITTPIGIGYQYIKQNTMITPNSYPIFYVETINSDITITLPSLSYITENNLEIEGIVFWIKRLDIKPYKVIITCMQHTSDICKIEGKDQYVMKTQKKHKKHKITIIF